MYSNGQRLLTADAKESETLSPWIHHSSSLTDKLQAIKGSTDLTILSQQWINPDWWDKNVLQINDGLIFQREIIMRSQGVDYWYARTIIPESCYALNPMFFKRLEQESIKNLIFGTSEVRRINMTSYPIDRKCIEFYWVKKFIPTIEGTLWVRFSEFSLQQLQPFYLLEVLLPALENISC